MADVTVSLATSGKDQVLGDLKSVESAGQKMGETFGSIAGKLAGLAAGYVSITATIGAFHGAMEKGGQLADFSEQTGIAVDKLVLLERAFENNGMKAEDLGSVINKMQKFLIEAGDAGSESADKLHRLGLFSSDLLKLSPDEQFAKIAKTISEIPGEADRAASAMEIFGKKGGRLLALFADLPGAINQAEGEVGGFAKIMDQNAAAFDYLGDGIAAIGQKLMEFAAGALVNIQGGLKEFVDLVKNFDAAGFGEKVTKDISAPLKAIADSLVDGNFSQALGVATELVKLEAMKIGNEIVKILQASFTVVAEFAGGTFASGGPVMVSMYNGFLDAGKFIGQTFKAAFLEAGSAANAWVNLAISAMKMDLPGVLNGLIQLKEVHNQFGEASYKTAQSWAEIGANAMDAGVAVYKMSDGYFDIATQQEKVQSMSEKIVSEHESMAKLTATIAANGKKYEESLVGVSQSFASFKVKGGEAGSLAEMAGLKMPAMNFEATGLGPIDTPEQFSTKPIRSGGRSSGASSGRNDMPDFMNKSDYLERNMSGEWVRSPQDKIDQRMETRAREAVQRDMSGYTGGDSRASREQTINDMFSKYVKDGVSGSRADLRKKAEADFNKAVNDKLRDSKGDPPGGVVPGYDNKKKKEPGEDGSGGRGTLKDIYDLLSSIDKNKLPVYALS
jgi:hypothetical protein